MTDEIKRWFIEKIAQNPDYVARTYLPELEKLANKSEAALREAIRNKGIEEIKYQMGWLDGVQKACALIDGLKISERKAPVETGLMSRIFQFGNHDNPSNPGNDS